MAKRGAGLVVHVVDESNNIISDFTGTGAVPTSEGDVNADFNGQMQLWEDAGDTAVTVSAAKPLPVNVVAGGTSGTQYTEGDADASVTGNAVMWEDAADTLRVASAAKPLPVNIVAGAAAGTEYTEGDVDASISGQAVMWEDSSDTLRAVSAAKPLPVDLQDASVAVTDNGGSLTVDGTVAVSNFPATQTVDGTVTVTEPVSVDDNGGSLTVDDGGASLTVDGTVAVSGTVPVDSELTTADLDTGAGTDTRAVVGIAGAASGGAALIEGTAANGLEVDVTRVGGTVTVGDGGSTLSIDDGGGTITVDGTVAVTEPVSIDDNGGSLTVDGTVGVSGDVTVIGKGADGAAVSGNPVLVAGQDGTNAQSLSTNASGHLNIADGGNSITVDGTVSVTEPVSIDDNGSSITVDGTVSVTDGVNVEGDVAHDGVDSGNPVKQGAKAVAHGANPAAVAANDRTDLYANRAGIPFVIGGHPNIVSREYVATTAQTDDPIITVAAGLKIVVTSILVVVDNATTVDVGVRIGFGTANVPTVPTDGNTVDGVVMTHPGIAAGSGVGRGDGAGILAIGADDQDLRITNEVPTTGSLRVLVTYYTIES